jgi:pilus assembly protein CpaE
VRKLSFVIFSEQEEFAQEMSLRLSKLRNVEVAGIATEIESLVELVKNELPDVLFADLGLAPHVILDQLEGIQIPLPDLLVCGSQDESRLILRAMQVGAKEFLPPAPEPSELATAVDRIYRAAQGVAGNGAPAPVISVMGAKGGVGATVVACQLAASLQSGGERTVLIDLNFPLGDVALHFDVDPEHTIADLVKGDEQIDKSFVNGILTEHSSGVHILAASSNIEDSELVTGQDVENLVAVLREQFDWVVIDVSRNWNEATVRALDLADQIFVTTLLDVPTLHHAKKHMELLTRLGHQPERVQAIVNRRSPSDAVSDKDFTAYLGREASAFIPNDYVNTVNSVNEGQPIHEIAPDSALDQSFRNLARQAHTWCGLEAPAENADHKAHNLADRVRGMFGKK